MSGFTKHQFDNDMMEIQKSFSKYLKQISEILPCNYNDTNIIILLFQYFPFECRILEEKYEYYKAKDQSLLKRKSNSRFNMKTPEEIMRTNSVFRNLIREDSRIKYQANFSNEMHRNNIKKFQELRNPKILKIQNKIDLAIAKTQRIDPIFLDELIGLYDKKTTTQKDKVYIFNELNKYYSQKIVNFFKKKVDTEYNRQLREMAFKHLQELMHFVPPLRKQK